MNFILDGVYQAGPWIHPKSLLSQESEVNNGDVRYVMIKEHGIDSYYKANKENEHSSLILWLPIGQPNNQPPKTPKKKK